MNPVINKSKLLTSYKLDINGKWFYLCTIIYIYIPIVLFLFTWIKTWIAIIVTITTGICIYHFIIEKINQLAVEPIYMDLNTIVVVLVIFFGITFFLGWSGFSKQPDDWIKHNAIIHDLVERNWPVYYQNGEEKSMLTYYIAQYLLPCILGKIAGKSFKVAVIANAFWGYIGLILAYMGFIRVTRLRRVREQLGGIVLFVFYSGVTILARYCIRFFCPSPVDFINYNYTFHSWDICLQYTSNLAMLRWVFPQCITPWIVASLLYEKPLQIKNYMILVLPLMLFSTFSFVGFLPILLLFCVDYYMKTKSFQECLKIMCSNQNILMVPLAIILLLYFSGNILGNKPAEIGFRIVNYGGMWYTYLFFCLFHIVIYDLFILKVYRRNLLFWGVNGILLILPLFCMGKNNDLLMRASIPALYYFLVMIVKFLLSKRYLIRKRCLCVALAVGMLLPVLEFSECITSTNLGRCCPNDTIKTLEIYANRNIRDNNKQDYVYNYYTYDCDNSIFVKYFTKK